METSSVFLPNHSILEKRDHNSLRSRLSQKKFCSF